ncbi:hypothetical protein EDB83DRAFT_1465652 [Lactarius deliciosus]|nr:hypothetical protein EDB83DRAFT_1465652 [Lactarius deliciosus]
MTTHHSNRAIKTESSLKKLGCQTHTMSSAPTCTSRRGRYELLKGQRRLLRPEAKEGTYICREQSVAPVSDIQLLPTRAIKDRQWPPGRLVQLLLRLTLVERHLHPRRSSSLRLAVEGVAPWLCPLARSSAVKVGAAQGAHRSGPIDGDGGTGIALKWENAGSSRLVGGCLTFSQRQSRPKEEPGICLLNSQPSVPFRLIIFIRCFPSSFCGPRWRWAGGSAGCVR